MASSDNPNKIDTRDFPLILLSDGSATRYYFLRLRINVNFEGTTIIFYKNSGNDFGFYIDTTINDKKTHINIIDKIKNIIIAGNQLNDLYDFLTSEFTKVIGINCSGSFVDFTLNFTLKSFDDFNNPIKNYYTDYDYGFNLQNNGLSLFDILRKFDDSVRYIRDNCDLFKNNFHYLLNLFPIKYNTNNNSLNINIVSGNDNQ